MSLTFPLNQERSQRIDDCANQIAFMQDEAVDQDTSLDMLEAIEVTAFEQISKRAGAASLEEYVERLMESMPAEVKEDFDKMRKELDEMDEGFRKSYLSDIGIALTGAVADKIWANLSEETIKQIMKRVNYNCILRMVNKAISAYARGVNALGAKIGQQAAKLANKIFGQTSRARNFLSKIGRFLGKAWGPGPVFGALLLIGILVIDAALGAKQRKQLRGLIIEAVSRRFLAKKADMEFELLSEMKGAMTGIASGINALDNLLHLGILTQEQYDTAIAGIYDDAAGPLLEALEDIDDDAVMKACENMDRAAQSWTDEDPDRDAINHWIEENVPDEDEDEDEEDAPSASAAAEAATTITAATPSAPVSDKDAIVKIKVNKMLARNPQFALLSQMAAANYRH